MIIKLSGADASQNNLGKIEIPENFQLETISAIAAFGNYSINSSQALALNTYITGLKTAGIWGKIKYFFLPTFAGDISSALYNVKANGKSASFKLPSQWSIDDDGFHLQSMEAGHPDSYYEGSAEITLLDPVSVFPFSAIAYFDKYTIPGGTYANNYNFILAEPSMAGSAVIWNRAKTAVGHLQGMVSKAYNFNATSAAIADIPDSVGTDNIGIINIKSSQGSGDGSFISDGSNCRGVSFAAPTSAEPAYAIDTQISTLQLFDLGNKFTYKDFKYTAKKYIVILMEEALTAAQETAAHTLTSAFINAI